MLCRTGGEVAEWREASLRGDERPPAHRRRAITGAQVPAEFGDAGTAKSGSGSGRAETAAARRGARTSVSERERPTPARPSVAKAAGGESGGYLRRRPGVPRRGAAKISRRYSGDDYSRRCATPASDRGGRHGCRPIPLGTLTYDAPTLAACGQSAASHTTSLLRKRVWRNCGS